MGEGDWEASSDGGVSGLYSMGCVGSSAGVPLLLLFWFGVEM